MTAKEKEVLIFEVVHLLEELIDARHRTLHSQDVEDAVYYDRVKEDIINKLVKIGELE